MKKLQFKCTLLSDVILNVKSASEGNNETLDFIPGGDFLGIVAGALYKENDPDVMDIVHNGTVRFGDAHPAVGTKRTVRVPADMFYPKLSSPSEQCYLHHLYNREKDIELNGVPMQLKQCRTGFYAFAEGEGQPAKTDRSFAIKSAYDSAMRRSRDEMMFGYESLNCGLELFFEVEVDKEALASKVVSNLVGEKHVGRSRSAQYGSILIEECPFEQSVSNDPVNNIVVVYADSRLIFLDYATGLPTFQPSALDLGLSSGEIDWSKTQIRTFQYSPWNSKRQSFDTDRCGIEKGSVFIVKNCTDSSLKSQYVGYYRNEGFGEVIYNPDFLLASDTATNGEAKYKLSSVSAEKKTLSKEEHPLVGTALLSYVAKAKKEEDSREIAYRKVNEFVENYKRRFMGESFASQWGTIRSIATTCHTIEELKHKLFDSALDENKKAYGYLMHGIGQKKWTSGKRLMIFRDWLEDVINACPDKTVEAVVNLAAEMAKLCKSK